MFELVEYKKRIIDKIIDEISDFTCAINIKGPKWCGKTWCGKFHSKTWYEILNPENNFQIKTLIELKPTTIFIGEKPILIDEWQEIPKVWDTVRFGVDNSTSKKLSYILTGSTTKINDRPIHSGAGRITTLILRTLSFFEMGYSSGKILVPNLFDKNYEIDNFASKIELGELCKIIVKGGWPEIYKATENVAFKMNKSYLESIINSDINSCDGVVRNPIKIDLLIKSISRSICRLPNIESYINDIYNECNSVVSLNTVKNYIEALKNIFIIEEIPAWSFSNTSKIRLRNTPKRIFADPSIICASLGIMSDELLRDTHFLGNVFESLVIKELLVYYSKDDAQLFHYRDNSDLEVDIIVKKPNGKYGAIEIKLSKNFTQEAINSLVRFKRKMKSDGQLEPEFLAVIVGVGEISRKTIEGVYILPIDHIG